MAFSALLIMIFHLWINLTISPIEMYIKYICFIGVDIFFFVSGYSLASKKSVEYKNFIADRVNKVYVKFVVFSIIGALYFDWQISKLIKTLLGIELITRGGGSFLWFIPGIMLFYFLLPLYKMIDDKYHKVMQFIAIIIYLFLTIIVSTLTNYEVLFILTNRIPITLMGYYIAKYNIFNYLNASKIRYNILTILLILLGLFISYIVYINHFNVSWFKDLFYILYIPLCLGLILLMDKLKENKFVILMGSITLELYGLQMLFGFKITNAIFNFTNSRLLSNLLTISVLIIMSVIAKYIFDIIGKTKRER